MPRFAPLLFSLISLVGRSSAQDVPLECRTLVHRDSIRLAVYLEDPEHRPWQGLGRVAIGGRTPDHRPQLTIPPLAREDGWRCSSALPRGDYMIEVRAMSFANEAFSVSRADSGLVVRVITLKPSPWRTEGVQYELATPRLTFSVEGVEGSDRSPSRLVDSVRISDSTVTIYGQRTLPSVGDGLRAHITNLGSYLILDVFVMPGTAVGAITVPLRYQAKISGLAIGPYRLTVRDMPLGGFTALSGYSSLINLRTREELDAGYVGPQ